MPSIEGLQAYLRAAAARTHDVVDKHPFRLFFNPNDALKYYNYAVPVETLETLFKADLESVRNEFAARGRLLRFEFLKEYTPRLGGLLEGLGVGREAENPLLICTSETLLEPPRVSMLEVRRLEAESASADLQAFIATQRRGFEEEPDVASDEMVADFRRRLSVGAAAFLGLLDGTPVAVASRLVVIDGCAELAGIATLEPYRRRGIAAVLTAAGAKDAFTAGASTTFLTAADENAARVYKNAGFRTYATGLAYSVEA